MAPEEWGMSPLKEREYIHPEQKIARKLQMKKGLISKSEAIAIYMEEEKHKVLIAIKRLALILYSKDSKTKWKNLPTTPPAKEKEKCKARRPHKLNNWGNKSKTLIR
ncbi:hypothetical protein H5410_014541 [Solanum commersonii]|uniref:Uncharacterized protein n=1 Tax=Solanum commersonii TaxID=4109 RepID=A0A9J5ZR61_SOLCO|nr:hypothetical protein H5410_014541 [Solanum commersonii]